MENIKYKSDDNKNHPLNPSKRSFWKSPIIRIIVIYASIIGIVTLWVLIDRGITVTSLDPLIVTLIFLVGIVYIFLLIYIIKKINSLFDDFENDRLKPSKMSIWKNPIIVFSMIFIIILSYVEAFLIFGFVGPRGGSFIFLVDIYILSLLIQLTNGNKGAYLTNVIAGLLIFAVAVVLFMMALASISS